MNGMDNWTTAGRGINEAVLPSTDRPIRDRTTGPKRLTDRPTDRPTSLSLDLLPAWLLDYKECGWAASRVCTLRDSANIFRDPT